MYFKILKIFLFRNKLLVYKTKKIVLKKCIRKGFSNSFFFFLVLKKKERKKKRKKERKFQLNEPEPINSDPDQEPKPMDRINTTQ